MPGTFVLSGYVDLDAYDNRTPSWEPDAEYRDLDAATAAAREWVVNQSSSAQVEVVEVERGMGRVKRVVDHHGIEEIE